MAPWWVVWVVSPLVLLLVTRWLWSWYWELSRDRSCKLPLPPGHMGWPVVGDMPYFIYLFLLGGDYFRIMRTKYGAVCRMHLFGKPLVRVAGTQAVRMLLLGEHSQVATEWPSSMRHLLGENIVSMSGADKHRHLRKIFISAVSKSALDGYVGPLQHVVEEEVMRWCNTQEGHHILVYEETQRLVQRSALEVLIGYCNVSKQEFAEFARYLHDFTSGIFAAGINIPGTTFHKAIKARGQLVAMLRVQMHKKPSELSFHSAMSHIQDALRDAGYEGDTEERMLLELMLEMLFAGQLSVRSAMTSLVMELGKHPDVVKKIQAELDNTGVSQDFTLETLNKLTYTDHVIKEVLRLHPPLGGSFRRALKTLEIGGYQIPKGWRIVYSIKDSHDSCPEFVDPALFWPDRWGALSTPERSSSSLLLTFAAGPRACAGKEFARIFLRLLTVTLVRTCKWTLINPDVEMKRFPNAHPADGLPVKFTFRQEFEKQQQFVENTVHQRFA